MCQKLRPPGGVGAWSSFNQSWRNGLYSPSYSQRIKKDEADNHYLHTYVVCLYKILTLSTSPRLHDEWPISAIPILPRRGSREQRRLATGQKPEVACQFRSSGSRVLQRQISDAPATWNLFLLIFYIPIRHNPLTRLRNDGLPVLHKAWGAQEFFNKRQKSPPLLASAQLFILSFATSCLCELLLPFTVNSDHFYPTFTFRSLSSIMPIVLLDRPQISIGGLEQTKKPSSAGLKVRTGCRTCRWALWFSFRRSLEHRCPVWPKWLIVRVQQEARQVWWRTAELSPMLKIQRCLRGLCRASQQICTSGTDSDPKEWFGFIISPIIVIFYWPFNLIGIIVWSTCKWPQIGTLQKWPWIPMLLVFLQSNFFSPGRTQ